MPARTVGEQDSYTCSIIRSGTSKGVYLRAEELPPPGEERDTLLRRIMGAPHFMRVDGIGGTYLLTSKMALIGPPSIPEADVDYTFVQVGVEEDVVDYRGNCGNISAGVGAFAIEMKLVAAREPVTGIRIHNTNTGKVIVAQVPISGGRARVKGDFAIDGVPGTGAEVLMDYSSTGGAVSGKVLPTGNRCDDVELSSGKTISCSLVDYSTPCVFMHMSDFGIDASVTPTEIDGNEVLLGIIREVRGKISSKGGLVRNWGAVDAESALLPLVVLVCPPTDYTGLPGHTVLAGHMDLVARLIFMNHCHEAMAGAGAICTAVAARIPGCVANLVTRKADDSKAGDVSIGHPSGIMTVTLRSRLSNRTPEGIEVEKLGFSRTVRTLMSGKVFVPSC